MLVQVPVIKHAYSSAVKGHLILEPVSALLPQQRDILAYALDLGSGPSSQASMHAQTRGCWPHVTRDQDLRNGEIESLSEVSGTC